MLPTYTHTSPRPALLKTHTTVTLSKCKENSVWLTPYSLEPTLQ